MSDLKKGDMVICIRVCTCLAESDPDYGHPFTVLDVHDAGPGETSWSTCTYCGKEEKHQVWVKIRETPEPLCGFVPRPFVMKINPPGNMTTEDTEEPLSCLTS